MRRVIRAHVMVLVALLLASPVVLGVDTAIEVYRTIGLDVADVLSGTTLNAQVIPGRDKQIVALTTYFTGSKERSDAVNVRLDVFNRRSGKLVSVYHRDFGSEAQSSLSDGNLEIFDLDRDGVNEIVVSFDSFADPLIEQRLGEVLYYGEEGFRTGWAGEMEYDATKAARKVPKERRDRYRRDLDLAKTLKSRGTVLVFNKYVVAVAGERLPQPKTIEETFPLNKQ